MSVGIIIKGKGDDKDPFQRRMEARVTYILMKAGVTGPEIDECILWAFGPDAWYAPIYPDWVDRWHKLHPKAFHVNARKDSFVEWIYVVGFFFAQQKEKERLKIKGGWTDGKGS